MLQLLLRHGAAIEGNGEIVQNSWISGEIMNWDCDAIKYPQISQVG